MRHIPDPMHARSSQRRTHTQGGYVYNTGITSFHWSPVSFMTGVWAAYMYGTFISVPAGFLVWIYSPFIIISAVEVFYGLGGCLFVGAGAAVMGRSQLIEIIAIVNLHGAYTQPFFVRIMSWGGGRTIL